MSRVITNIFLISVVELYILIQIMVIISFGFPFIITPYESWLYLFFPHYLKLLLVFSQYEYVHYLSIEPTELITLKFQAFSCLRFLWMRRVDFNFNRKMKLVVSFYLCWQPHTLISGWPPRC